ncbi:MULTISPECIES: hypothetical protein [Burkholderia]|uniref:hypothetical protein n=1 Tax=Burkholderia TaxID=32008 RepID=UPI0035ABF5BF
MKSAICSAIVLCVPVLVLLVVLLVVLVVPVVLDVPVPLDVPEPCGDLKALAPGAPPEPSEPPQAAVISVTDAQSVAPIKVRVPRKSAILSVYLFYKQRKVPRPPGRDGTLNAGRRRDHRRPAKSGMASTTPCPENNDGIAPAHAKRALNERTRRPPRFVPRRADALRSSMPTFTATGQSAEGMAT